MSSDVLAMAWGKAMGVDHKQFNMFFERMMDGFAYHKIVVDKAGKPIDYVFLEVNNAFERMTGLKKENIIGKRVTEVLKGIENDPADWIGVYGRVALTGEPVQFENHAVPLGKWFYVSAYCPERGHFAAIFEDITQRKKAEAEIARLASFPELNPNPVVEVDFDCKVQYANPAAKAMFSEELDVSCHPMFADLKQVVENLRSGKQPSFSREVDVDGRAFYQTFYLVPNVDRARFYAVNIDSLKNAQNALKESEQRWATTVSSIGDAVITTDLAGNVTFLNSIAENLTGWTLLDAAQKPLKTVFNIVNEQTRNEVESPVSRVLKEGTVVGLANHTTLLRKDGAEVPIDDSGAPIRDKDGNVKGVVLVFRDITERKKAEEALRESEVKFRTVANFTYDWEHWMSPEGKLIYVSPSCERVTGFKAEEFIKNPRLLTEIVHPEDRALVTSHFDKVDSKELHEVDYRIVTRGGEVRWISHVCQVVFDEEGKWLGRRGSNRDITGRKKAETELLESEERLNRSQEIAHLGSWELDLIKNELTWSDEVYRIFGLKPQEFGASYEAFLEAVHPDDRTKVDNAYASSLREGRDTYEVEHRIVRKTTGEIRTVHEKCQHLRDASRRVVRSVGMVHDITESKKAEESLLKEKAFSESAVNSLPGVFYLFDKEGKFLRWNENFEAVTGYSATEISSMRPTDFFEGEDKRRIADAIGQVFTRGCVQVEANFVSKNGKRKPFFFLGRLMLDGNVPYVVGEGIDITERKEAENALKRLNEDLEERVRKRTDDVSKERQRLYNVLEALPSYVILLDRDHHVVFANRVFRETFGEDHGRRCHEYLFNKDCECENCETYKVLKENKPQHWYWTGPNGHDYDIYDYPFKEADGSTLILEMGIDITERKRAEKQVKAAAQYSRSLIEASLDPLVTINSEGKITDVNKATENATGCARSELIGSDFSEYFTEPEQARSGYKKVFTEGYVVDYPLALKSKSGKIIDVLYNASVYRDDKGEIQGVFAAARDVTERNRAEAELKKHREHLEELVKERTLELWQAKNDWERTFDSVPDLIALLDKDHRIVRVNQAMAKMFGVEPQKCVGLPCYESVHGEKQPPCFCPHSKTMEDGKEHIEEVYEPRLGGYFLVSTTPLFSAEGKMIGSVHVARNITDRKQMQTKLEEYAAHLEELVEERTQQLKNSERLTAIGETAGMVGHDLRNPLQTVTGETFLAKDELKSIPDSPAKENLAESIQIIADQISYMDKIVSDLQDFVRPITPDKKQIDLKQLLSATLTQITPAESIRVQTQIRKDLPNVSADAQLLKRVFFNLFTNAVQAMPDGGKLTVRALANKSTGTVVVHVEDTGNGIPDSVKPKLFRPLFTTKSKGQGFGLAVCRRVIEAHGGTITFESQEGKGTRFTVELPT